jgi:L-galactose dehydrogenase
MDRVRLGRTELDVSVASLGAGGASKLGQGYGASSHDSVRLVQVALDRGINAVDTAAAYETEKIIGAAITGRRDDEVLSTKSTIFEQHRPPYGAPISGAKFCERVDESLARLQTDYIDIMHVHGLSPRWYDYCIGEILPAMHRLRESGKIRFLGVSEAWGSDTEHQMLQRALEDDHFDVIMLGLNIINHSAESRVLPLAMNHDVGTQCMYAVRGKLASAHRIRPLIETAISAGEIEPGLLDLDDPLGFLTEPGVASSLTDACYRFARHTPGIDTVLTGTGNATHLRENISSLSSPPLPGSAVERIKHVFGKVRSVTGD